MKLVLLFLVAFLLNGCITAKGFMNLGENTYLIKYYTGTAGSKWYDSAFEVKSNELCPNGFEVLEKTYTPAEVHPDSLDNAEFYWRIKCR